MKLSEQKIKQLIAMMNSLSEVKIPPMKPILECFDMGMDEDMMDFLLEVGPKERTLEELKAIYGKGVGSQPGKRDWDSFFGEILEMSFLFPADHERRDVYQLASIFPGWIELSVSGPLNEKRKAILNKFMEFWGLLSKLNILPIRLLTNMQGMKERDTGTPHMGINVSHGSKEISLNQPLTSEQQVRVVGEVYQLLKRHENEIAVMNCFCRQYKSMNGLGECREGLPIEGCISLGAVSRQLVENGVARHLTYEEACDMMDDFEKKGCIHTTYHYGCDAAKEEIVICNCCKDCCLLYSGYLTGGISKIFVKSYYIPQMKDESKCVGCNKCGRYCPTEATWYDKANKKLVFDAEKCIGCGQCVNQCAFDVREMVRNERNVFVKTKAKKKAAAHA